MESLHPRARGRRARVVGAFVASLALGTVSPGAAGAQTQEAASGELADPARACGFERCGLRLEGRNLFRGAGDERVGRFGDLYADLRFLETAGDSAAFLAREATRAYGRGSLAQQLGMVASWALYPTFALPLEDRELDQPEAWTRIGVGAGGLILTIIGSRWLRDARASASRAVWWYNRDVAAGAVPVPGVRPDLPPLQPDHFGRSGLLWGATIGMALGNALALHTSSADHDLLYLTALPVGTATLGWLVGRAKPR